MAKQKSEFLRLPVVSAGAEFLVMGYLMRRNILTYKAPSNNEGYDLICIHPNPRHQPMKRELAQVRVQVTRVDSHYQLSNRVAHLWKHATCKIPVILLYLGFCGDREIEPSFFRDEEPWQRSRRDRFKMRPRQVLLGR